MVATVPVREFHMVFSRLDGLFYELGYVITKPKFAAIAVPGNVADATKTRLFYDSRLPANRRIPQAALTFASGELESLENSICATIGDGEDVLGRLKDTDEMAREPIIQAVEVSDHNQYLVGPKVDIYKLDALINEYAQDHKRMGKLNRAAMYEFISRKLAEDYETQITASQIKDAFKQSSSTTRLPRGVLYILLEVRDTKKSKFHNRFFDSRVPLKDLIGAEDYGAWSEERATRYGFNGVPGMHKALADDTKIPYSTITRQLGKSTTIKSSIVRCFRRWERKHAETGDIGEYPQYRVVDVKIVGALLRELARNHYGENLQTCLAEAESYTPLRRKTLSTYTFSEPRVSGVGREIYEGLLRMQSDLTGVPLTPSIRESASDTSDLEDISTEKPIPEPLALEDKTAKETVPSIEEESILGELARTFIDAPGSRISIDLVRENVDEEDMPEAIRKLIGWGLKVVGETF